MGTDSKKVPRLAPRQEEERVQGVVCQCDPLLPDLPVAATEGIEQR